MREFTRVLKEQIEDKAKINLECQDNITLWMIRWAAMLCSRFLVGKDGRTGYERRKRRTCTVPVVSFGEKIWCKEIRETKERKNKFDTEEKEGICIGHSRNTNEVLVGTREGVVRAYSIKRRDEENMWDGELMKSIQGTRQQPDPRRLGQQVPITVRFDEPEEAETISVQLAKTQIDVRSIRITSQMLETHGYTEGCEGCRFKRSGFNESRAHTETCRRRMMEAVSGTEEGRLAKQRGDPRTKRGVNEKYEKEEERRHNEKNYENEGKGASVDVETGRHDEGKTEANRRQDEGRLGGDEDDVEMSAAIKEAGDPRSDDTTDEVKTAVMEAIKRLEVETDLAEAIRITSMGAAEVYSPPRVTDEAKNFGLKPGEAMDLTTG